MSDLKTTVRRVGYYLHGVAREAMPHAVYAARLRRFLAKVATLPLEWHEDAAYLNKLPDKVAFSGDSTIGSLKIRGHSRYYLDAMEYLTYFDPHLKVETFFADAIHIPDLPTLIKSRPVDGENRNSVLLNLDKLRHFQLFDDPHPFEAKVAKVVWRGANNNPLRRALMERHAGHERCDLGFSGGGASYLTPQDQMGYRYILSIEGHDVATNLKWVMASRSLCVMPRPKYETWLMEGRLEAGVHYAEVRDDFADLEEVIAQYEANPQAARRIIANANGWVRRVADSRREKAVSLLVLLKYFRATGQMAAG